MKRVVTIALVLAAARAEARDIHVTAVTPTTIYIDAGSADGLVVGATWQITLDGRTVAVRVAAVASHDAELELAGPRPAIGAVLGAPPGLTPPSAVVPRPPPAALPPWRDDPAALASVQAAASHEQPASETATDETYISGELALSAFFAGDMRNTSTSSQDLSLSSQLAIESGAWRYDHLIDAHIAATPEVFQAPLQHARARFDVYLMRLAYQPGGERYAAAIGRQTGAPLGELGTVDGGQLRVALARQLDLTAFAGLRPAYDLGVALAPRAGADIGYLYAQPGVRGRADAGLVVDEYKGSLDRAAAAASAALATPGELVHADAVVDLASDANGKAGRLTRASALARAKRGRITASASAGYDRPFIDRVLIEEVPDLVLGPRTFGAAELRYAWRHDLDLGTSARASWGDGFSSTYVDVLASWYEPARSLRANVAPHVIVGSLVDQVGVRANLGAPIARWHVDLGGAFDRVYANGERAWAGIGQLSGSRAFRRRWRTALSLEAAAGDGPPRVLAFALLGYRLGN